LNLGFCPIPLKGIGQPSPAPLKGAGLKPSTTERYWISGNSLVVLG